MFGRHIAAIAAATLLLSGCRPQALPEGEGLLEGAWLLLREEYPAGQTYDYPDRGVTLCRLFSGDSVVYECALRTLYPNDEQKLLTASDVRVVPYSRQRYSLIPKGGGEVLLFVDDEPCPLSLDGDSLITTQRGGVRRTWRRATLMSAQRLDELRQIIESDLRLSYEEQWERNYVLLTTERQLKAANHTLTYIIIIMGLLLGLTAAAATAVYRRNRRIARRLRQIEEEREQRPQPVRQAMQAVEDEFLHGDYYLSMRRRLAVGERLRPEDWSELEQRLKPVYPGFSNHLFSLHHLSQLEYQVCLLVKLRATPSEMAAVLSRDVSTISSIRGRLYQKVFKRKGSSRLWDEFVLSL